MQQFVRRLSILLTGFVVLAFIVDGLGSLIQPVYESGAAEGVLRTFDPDGTVHENRLAIVDDAGTLWVQSGHHLRGWFWRLQANDEVELIRNGITTAYRAIPIDTPETEARIAQLLKARVGTPQFWLIRTITLFADIKPVRLDPR